MLILAIDSATPVAGVALLNEDKLIREEFINYKKTHSETLMPMINQLLAECEADLSELTAIAVTIGPGSFTGLRIGMAAVKGLSLATSKPVVGIPTLDVLAHNISYSEALVCPLLDARKQEVYTSLYNNTEKYPEKLCEDMACSPELLVKIALEKLAETGKEHIMLLGDGYMAHKDYLENQFAEKLLLSPVHLMLPRASALGSLAIQRVLSGEYDDIVSLQPVYVRLSEAENRLNKGEI